MKLLIFSTEGEAFFDLLRDVPNLEIVIATTPEEAVRHAADADVIYARPTRELLAVTKARWIQSPSAGVDFLLGLPELVESDIILTNTRGAHGPSIAEHVFALLLALTRCLPTCWEWQKAHHWGRAEGYRLPREIKGSTIGIIGYGAIGRSVAQRAVAFEMNVLAVDAVPGSGAPYCEEVWPVDRLADLLRASDVVVVAAPYTKQTHHLLGEAEIAMMKPDAYLITVSRGGIIDEAALVKAMQSGHLAGAGIDVTEREPLPPDSPLWDLPNVIITPHLAGSSAQKERRCVEILRENLLRYQRGEPLINVVDKRAGY
ncbi:MAG: hydroxyacid dehydrogenase [Thermomicrobiales bacterium]|nr:MAG: hydroxyacid dehydrogenase [Thermomicrobiales bacterium]